MASTVRTLRPVPSNTDELAGWQRTVSTKLADLHQESFEKRMVLTHFIQALPQPTGEQAIQEVTMAMQIAYNLDPDSAEAKAR